MTSQTGLSVRVPRIVVAVAFSLPALMMVIGSFRRPGQPPLRSADFVPDDPTFAGYEAAFDLTDLAGQLLNSLLVAFIATPVAVLCASGAGFVIARATRGVARILIGLAVIGVVVPPATLLIGRFTLYRELGVLDTYVPLLVPALYGVSSLAVLLFAWAFSRIPRNLFEVADIDGVSPIRVWAKIAMPLTRPMTIAVATLAFAMTWNDFLSPLVFLTSEDKFTVPLGLRSLQLVGGQDLPVLLAGCVVATAPVVAVFAIAQRWLFAPTQGLT